MSFIDKTLGKLFGNKSDRDLKELAPYLTSINKEYDRIKHLDVDGLRAESQLLKNKIQDYIKAEKDEIVALKEKIEKGDLPVNEKEETYDKIDIIEKSIDDKIEEVLDQILPAAFCIVKETARRFTENEEIEVTATQFDRDLAARADHVQINGDKAVYFNSWTAGGTEVVWNMVHYDVQMIGGVVLHQGKIAEMATGEGKTLVATLPVFLNALTGRGVHVITVNDYLAKRDSEWMGPIYQFHGLSVDCIDKHTPNSDERRTAYACDITFGTNNEFGFDYLRDNMATNPKDLVQRRHNYSIVDEVDSVLVDDARTPLIISGPIPRGEHQLYDELKPKVQKLAKAQSELVMGMFTDAKRFLKSEDKKEQEQGANLLLRTYKGMPKMKPLIKFLSEQGNKALLIKTENFYMQENNKNMHIITDDLYFVIDEKQNSIELTDKGIDLITDYSDDAAFFVLPDIGSEVAEIEKSNMTDEEKLKTKDEMIQSYAVKSERVHTINQLLKAYSLFEKDVEYVLMDGKVKIVDEQTGRIMEGRRYSDGLHQAIEAKESVKVEAATQTFATITLQNYFRMYHKLSGMTGTAETEAGELWDIYKLDVVVIPTNRPISRDDREDLVYKTKREKYNAVIDEIGELVKAGRPVLVGTTSVEISELLSRMLKLRGIKHNVLNAKLHQREADIVAEAGYKGTVTIATNMAGRGTDIKLSEEVKAAGGLAIIGTERHDSRRVDRQLRGRAGRQGDVGSSQFFVSLEDDLMRLFSSDRIVKLMDRMGIEDGEVISHSMISKSIERAQKKVEENNFGIRKRLLEYDDVMNSQREVIYKRRRHALFGERIQVDIANMMFDVSESLVNEYHGGDYEDFKLELIRVLSIESPITEEAFMKEKPEDISQKIYEVVLDAHKRKVETISKQAYPVIKDVYETKSGMYENIVVPISDGTKNFQVVTNLKKAYETEAEELVRAYEKVAILATIDDSWKEHLREMDDLKQSVQNASYEQKDPLLIYKFESFNLFKSMIETTNKSVVATLMKGHIPLQMNDEIQEAKERRRTDMSGLKTSKDDLGADGRKEPKKAEPVRNVQKVGRNESCPCGSGKKFKQCHGKGMPA
ncbi:preprotein translocase subunit SecA [Ancylomarina euxinus]|uniref:Protein translocase subunit SecA n=1 Tax=Ancylomarina euxinus TaxID=2283627 RepID=A0A425Y492_9BACT|nr:preprotein translocase subunit SecA [Ancylomarina euxinus]MCZ4694691.1 preprotein translocase subunit SecA [Ancylomarina euxinus]MUP14235.1 preprotein translocase subunit SecA [Ancylomarina euxinus]RRG23084.1 preprotein translocase subunit SecA [Ancylomarina euxinus]